MFTGNNLTPDVPRRFPGRPSAPKNSGCDFKASDSFMSSDARPSSPSMGLLSETCIPLAILPTDTVESPAAAMIVRTLRHTTIDEKTYHPHGRAARYYWKTCYRQTSASLRWQDPPSDCRLPAKRTHGTSNPFPLRHRGGRKPQSDPTIVCSTQHLRRPSSIDQSTERCDSFQRRNASSDRVLESKCRRCRLS